MDDKKIDLNFLHKVCRDSHHMSLAYWIENADFYNEVSSLVSEGKTIDIKTVFDIMKRIYLSNEANRKSGKRPNFNFMLARQGLKSLWKSMTGSTSGWRG